MLKEPVSVLQVRDERFVRARRVLTGLFQHPANTVLIPSTMPEIHDRHVLRKCLILIVGVAGSGKSTLARQILRRIIAVYLDNNHIADAFFPHTRDDARYRKLRPKFYKILYRIVEENLKVGNSVLLDVPHVKEMQKPHWRIFIKQLTERNSAGLVVIRCRCSEPVLRQRLAERQERRDQWKIEHWSEFLEEQPIRVSIPLPHLEIDTEMNLRQNTVKAVGYILTGSDGGEQGR